MSRRVHLHRDDCPRSLGLLEAIIRDGDPGGFEPTEAGAFVVWDLLTTSYLSTTEVAAVRIAEGCAALERHGGGLPTRLRKAVQTALVVIDDRPSIIGRERALVDKLASMLQTTAARSYAYSTISDERRGSAFEVRMEDGRVARVTVELDRVEDLDGAQP